MAVTSTSASDARLERRGRCAERLWMLVGGAIALSALVATATWAALTVAGFAHLPSDGSVAASFARDMSSHHRQAVEMAELIRPNTADAEIRRLATDIVLTQQAQVGQMQGWLDAWGLPATGAGPPMGWMNMSHDAMPGMATAADLNRLRDLRGVEADREFLRLMIAHHRGGVAMAEAALRRTDQAQVVRLASSIVSTQASEIQVMADLLGSSGSIRAPTDANAAPTP